MEQTEVKTPSPLLEIVLTVILPSFALDYLSSPARLGPFNALLVSLLFPVGFMLWCWYTKCRWNIFSIFGLATILLSGGLGLLKLDAVWVAAKESVMPVLLGLAFPLSHRWGKPILDIMIHQPQLLNQRSLQKALDSPEKQKAFDGALYRASWGIGLGMLLSSVGNFFFALYLLEGKTPGSEEFVKGLATLTWAGLFIIGIPLLGLMMLVMMRLIRSIRLITGLDQADLLSPGKTVRRQVRTGE